MIAGSISSRISTSRSLIVVAMALMAIGSVMVFSATANLDATLLRTDDLDYRQFSQSKPLRQVGFATAAVAVMLIAARFPYRWWRARSGMLIHPAGWLLLLTIVALVLVYVPGIGLERNGAQRWIRIGSPGAGLQFQPSELAKLTLVLFLAVWMTRPTTDMRRFWKGLFPACVVLGILVGMVGAEDLGTAALLAAVGVALLIAGGARIMHLILLALPGVITFAAMIISKPYRVERLMSFTDIWATPRTTGYQAVQSLLTIISGGWQGKGVGMGVQKLGYLPEGDTDFIYAIICEELGFAGGALVIGLFLALLWCGRNALRHAADDLGRYIVLGVMLMMGMQAAMNIGVVTVSLPTTGIALPLVSAGGSGLLILGLSVGLVANVARSPSPADEEVEPARLRSRLGSRVAHAV